MFFVSKKKYKEMVESKNKFQAIAEEALDRLKNSVELQERTTEELYVQKQIMSNLKRNHAKILFEDLNSPLDKLILGEITIEAFVNEFMKIREYYLGDENDL